MRSAVLYLVPSAAPTSPVLSSLVSKMVWALQNAKTGACHKRQGDVLFAEDIEFNEGGGWRGIHQCSCGAESTNLDYLLPGGEIITNSLAAHYLACHNHEIPMYIRAVLREQAERHGWQEAEVTADHPFVAIRGKTHGH